MKTNHIIQRNLAALALLATFSLQPSALLGQGSLTPPGLPAPTMKSADQIYAKLDPRTPISSAPYTISVPGSYYLTTNLVMVSGQNGIEIAANNVTLDLNGFALLGGGHGGSGIHIPGAQTNITVRNGTISDWVNNGVDSDSYFSMNLVFERLNISANPAFGIYMSGAGVVRDCICENNGTGIFLGSYSEAIGNICIGNGTGIFVVGSNNRIENNHVAASGSGGIQVSGNGNYNNLIIKNSVSGNGANNYVGIAGNIVGPLITNTVSGIITNSNPWANFSF